MQSQEKDKYEMGAGKKESEMAFKLQGLPLGGLGYIKH